MDNKIRLTGYPSKGDPADEAKSKKNLNNINSANTFKANQITGNRIVYLLLNSLKGNGEYEKLKSIEVNGIKLLDGVDDIDTPEFDKSLIDKISSDNIHNELTEIANKIRQSYL